MKKLLMLLMLLCSVSCFAQSQNKWWDIIGFTDNIAYSKKDSIGLKQATNKNLYLSGIYLQKSVSYEYSSIILGALSGAAFVFGSHAKSACYTGGAILGASSLICYFISLDCGMKAGKDLKFAASPIGATLSYNF